MIGGNDWHALVQSLILELCVEAKRPTGVVGGKTVVEATVPFLLSALSTIPLKDLVGRRIAPSSFPAFNDAAGAIYDAPLVFAHHQPRGIRELGREARRLRTRL